MARTLSSRPKAELDAVDRLLLDLASALLAEYFFDPDNEARYLTLYPARRAPADDPPLAEDTMRHQGGTLTWRLEVLGQRNGFRVVMKHRAFAATVEGTWQFQREALRNSQVTQRSGSARRIANAARSLVDTLTTTEPSDEELSDLLAALAGRQEAPLIGDNPAEPPLATSVERDRVRSLVARLTRRQDNELPMEDRMWLEMTPQTLPVLTELLVEAMAAEPRREASVAAYLDLLTLQLEFVRYRLDRGWDWAATMLSDYQQRLIEIGRAGTLDAPDWFAMVSALSQARVPVSDAAQTALADAGLSGAATQAPPEELLGALRHLSDELAGVVGSPFQVIEALKSAGAVMPASLRGFMATELALSAHAVLREAAPLLLLDPDQAVRRAAAAALEQTAAAVSPESLRRAITIRNWIPQADRADLDRAIRKARAAGVPIAAWPLETGEVASYATMVDGSGAQSILSISRGSRKGLLAGLLLKHGAGIQDAWLDPEMSRSRINGILRELKSEVPSDEVDRSYVDAAVQHAIAAGLTHGAVAGDNVLAIAERIGGREWKDRPLDVSAEAERLFTGLAEGDRRPDRVQASLESGAAWMARAPIAASWFEDSKDVRRVIAQLPRREVDGAVQSVLREILPGTRLVWAERFLLMALWCRAAASKAHRAWATDFIVLTHALTSSVALEAIPIMNRIAMQTVMAARSSGW